MTAHQPAPPRIIMISGPIASGKSTVARAVGDCARRHGLTVAITDLDTIAAMAIPTLLDWEWAHTTHARLVEAWLETPVDLVIDEGTSNRHEIGLICSELPAQVHVMHVILTSPFELSHSRAQADPHRGLSRDAEFLRRDHEAFQAELPFLPHDLVIDVAESSPAQIAQYIWGQYLDYSRPQP